MLINCKNCGKPISDKAKVCPHCGSVVINEEKQTKPSTIDYMTLSPDKRTQLLYDFAKENQADGDTIFSTMQKPKRNRNIIYVSALVLLIFVIISAVLMGSGNSSVGVIFLIVSVLLALVLIILTICLLMSNKKIDYNYLKAIKRCELWMTKKGITNIQLFFANIAWKNAYENIKIEEDNN